MLHTAAGRMKAIMHPKHTSGQNLVEFVLILPVLMMIAMGVLDAGRLFGSYIALKNASREGARLASMDGSAVSVNAVRNRVIAEAESSGIVPMRPLYVNVITPNGWGDGQPVIVQVRYEYTLLSSLVFGTRRVEISAQTEMVIIGSPG